MGRLVTDHELAVWAQTTDAAIAGDPFAQEIIGKVSALLCEIAGQPTWDTLTAPIRVRMLAIKVVRRTYVNPDQEVSSTTGPISSRVLDEAALASTLTETDLALLQSYSAEGADQLYTRPMSGDTQTLLKTVYVMDNDQPNLVGPSWMIPFGDAWETDAFNQTGDVYPDGTPY